jgi:hypothetical protein
MAWELMEIDGTWWAWVYWDHQAGGGLQAVVEFPARNPEWFARSRSIGSDLGFYD